MEDLIIDVVEPAPEAPVELPKTVETLDRLTWQLENSKVHALHSEGRRLQAEKRRVDAELATVTMSLEKADSLFKAAQAGLQVKTEALKAKYLLKEKDDFDPDTGEITRAP